ncbi:MAG: hypothetical protein H0U40_04295 [Chloroflexia bacterium]|nr:hypothetical protein [Chloroflexia bacterium]MDQ3513137.1 hypothetical protein [Chloroflexota bacterium]
MPRVTMLIALLVLLPGILAGSSLAHGGHATPVSPAPSGLPVAAAPFGLGSVVLPNDQAGVEALFDRLPDEMGGEPLSLGPERSGERTVASYGESDPLFGPSLTLQAINFAEGDFFPRDFTGVQFVASAAGTADYGAETFGRDGNLAWVRAETTAAVAGDRPGTPEAARPIYTLAWGELDSPWLFTAAAVDAEGLRTLVTAFVTAATADQATPVPMASPRVRAG